MFMFKNDKKVPQAILSPRANFTVYGRSSCIDFHCIHHVSSLLSMPTNTLFGSTCRSHFMQLHRLILI